jgi:excisionase family DNA binding protein
MWLSTTKMAKRYGVTSETIRRWIREGKFSEVQKTDGGHIRVKDMKERRFLYGRVSSAKQRSSLYRQEELLREKYPNEAFISDIASAFNFKRKGLQTILELAMSGVAVHVVVTSNDRLARSGFELIRWIVELHGGTIKSLEEGIKTEAFDTGELIGFITSFCNSYYGKRSSKRRQDSDSIEKNTILS